MSFFKKKPVHKYDLDFVGVSERNVTLIIAVCILILAGLIFYFAFNSNFHMEESGAVLLKRNKVENNIAKTEKNVKMVFVKNEDKKCEFDSDCVIFQPDCGECEVDVLNKESFNDYENKRIELCTTMERPYDMCDMVIYGEPACEEEMCVFVVNEDDEDK